MLCCHLLSSAETACAHDLATACTIRTRLLAAGVNPTAHTVTTCEVAGTLTVVAAVVDLLLDVVHLVHSTHIVQRQRDADG